MKLFNIPHTHYICTAEESQDLDRRTIEDFGIPGYTLMEVAGSKTAEQILAKQPTGAHGLILCGKGNNGGDALVVARYLVQYNIEATLVFISGTDDLSADTEANFALIQKMSRQEPHRDLIHTIEHWNPKNLEGDYDFLIDGMLGTGLDSELRGDYQKAVEWANSQDTKKYAIDVPTGLNADSGKIMGQAMKVDCTFTFGALKQGFYLNEGPQVAGEPVYCDLPFPNYLKKDFQSVLIDESWVDDNFPIEREPARHKYERGILYVIAGSEGLTGAAVMAAKSAWKEGIGAVVLVCPRGLLPVFETKLTQVITRPVGDHEDYHFKSRHLQEILDIVASKPGKVIFGPGIGRESETVELTHQLLAQYTGSLIMDADGLWCLSRRNWEVREDQELIITPHPGEFNRLLDTSLKDDLDRLEKARALSDEQGITILSKGNPVLLTSPKSPTFITGYDTRVYSRAGFGDVLAGKIGACWMMTDQTTLACVHALLNGKKKTDLYRQNSNASIHQLEPLDLI